MATNGRLKGSRFEMGVCKLLHAILSEVFDGEGSGHNFDTPAHELVVRRRTTTVAPMDDWTGAGDLQVAAKYARLLTRKRHILPCVECKALDRIALPAVLAAPNKHVLDAWQQAVDQAAQLEYGVPLLAVALPAVGTLLLGRSRKLRDLLEDGGGHVSQFNISFADPHLSALYAYGFLYPVSGR